MPFYEYRAKELECSCEQCRVILEIEQSIKDKPLTKCPHCDCAMEKLVSLTSGIVIKGRQVNQFQEVQNARYWRDVNGVRHKVTPADGHSGSATVGRQTDPPEVVAQRIKANKEHDKKKRLHLQEKIAKSKAEDMKKKQK